MSFNKIKSLKLQRHNESTIKQQDTLMMLADEMKTQPERMDKPLSQNRVKHQESLTPLHSTPKRSSGQSSSAIDRQDYQISPMMLPCTQEVANEVAWDWHSPLTKTRETRRRINNGESISTPKRTNLLKKKRNSNSPLLYNPIKRKLLRSENQQESIEKFTAEMKALSEQIKTVPRENDIRVSRIEEKTKNETDDELLIQIDIEDFVECENRPDATSIVDNNAQRNTEIRRHGRTSMDDLFDDSIEDSMVKCSQEVEEKLRLETYHDNATRTNSTGSGATRTNSAGSGATRTNSAGSGATTVKDFSWHQQSYANCLASKEKSQQAAPTKFSNGNNGANMKNSSSSLCSTTDSRRSGNTVPTLKTSCLSNKPTTNESHRSSNAMTSRSTNSFSSANTDKATSTKSVNDKLSVSRDNELFVIPDDSFDDDFLDVCFDDVEDKTSEKVAGNVEKNQSPQRYGKVYESPHSAIPKDSRRNVDSTVRKVLLPPPSSQSAKVGNSTTKMFPRSSSNDSFGASASSSRPSSVQISQTPTTTTTTATNQARKFFKTKSLSTSSFDDGKSTIPNGKTSNPSTLIGLKMNNSRTNSVSIAKQRQTIKTGNPRANNAWESKNGGNDNHSSYVDTFDRNERREDGGRLRINNDSVQQQKEIKDTATGSQYTTMCTPEEIERKRIEAKMKLEAKRKLQARSKSAGLLTGGAKNVTKR